MTTGAEIVLEWFRKYSEQNGTPTPFEIRCQLELAIEHDKTELKKLRVADVVGRSEQLVCVHPYNDVYQSDTECYCEKCGKDLTEVN